MTTFDRHIIRRFAAGFLLLTGGLIVFFILLHYLEHMDEFMDQEAEMREIFLVYYPNYIPEIIRLTSPLALFLACVYLTGKLAQELQLTALQTSGVSLYRLMRPFVLVAVVFTGFMFWFNGWVVPVTNQTVLEFEREYLRDAAQQLDVSDIHRQNTPGGIITVGYYDRRDETAHRISLHQFDDGRRLRERVDARRMWWEDSTQTWRLEDVTIRTFDTDGSEHRLHETNLDTTLLVYPRDFARTERDIESMTIPIAREYVDALQRSGISQTGRTLVGYYSKFSYPLANLIVVLIAVPLASVRRRGGQAMQIALGLATAFAYLAVMKIFEPFGYAGTLPAWLVSWLPHVLFFFVALAMLWQTRK